MVGDGGGALQEDLGFKVRNVGGGGVDVVPGVEFEGVIGGEEVAGAELEGGAAFEVVGRVVGAVGGWCGGLCGRCG